jgi:hypothetical protein
LKQSMLLDCNFVVHLLHNWSVTAVDFYSYSFVHIFTALAVTELSKSHFSENSDHNVIHNYFLQFITSLLLNVRAVSTVLMCLHFS